MPDKIISDEYITIEGEKLSKSKGNNITLRHLLDNYDLDTIRYYFSINNPDIRDFNFNYEGFINSINGELLVKWGNFVSRTLKFINKSFNGKLESNNIDNANTKNGIIKIFDYISYSNKYFDECEPWNLYKLNTSKCEDILYNCCNIIFNINNLLKPYLVKSTKSVEKYLNSSIIKWNYKRIDRVNLEKNINPLFIRYDKSLVLIEKSKLNHTK